VGILQTAAQSGLSFGASISACSRIAPDGRMPADNPFAGSLVYGLGFRNPQGLAWDKDGLSIGSQPGPQIGSQPGV
jgi:glucose/arabinose dehydrogenase